MRRSATGDLTMFCCVGFKKFFCRMLFTLLLFSYVLMILLFLATVDITETQQSAEEESFSLIFQEPTFRSKREFSSNTSHSFNRHLTRSEKGVSRTKIDFQTPTSPRKIKVQFLEPVPISQPLIDGGVHSGKSGDFIIIGKDAYVYSAFLDDRKENGFVRIMTLMSQKASALFIYCLFNDSTKAEPQKSEHYQLCENHNKNFGGYIYSCRVPDSADIKGISYVVISLTKYGPRVKMPVLRVSPPKHKLEFLESYPHSTLYSLAFSKRKQPEKNVPLIADNAPSLANLLDRDSSPFPLSFALCVSPLYGSISVHRLVEFIELSRILGAEHFFFYNHSISPRVSAALGYYINKNLVTVLPWLFPSDVESQIWYHGQLLANNDCMYRAMPYFDLVSFNDLDEFIVPHSNATTWREAFSSMLTEDRCGFSFKSAFYDPGSTDLSEEKLLTPMLTAKSQVFSKVRTKVMLCPWRVFEVGIHHISKQNREDWRPWGVDSSYAYLHHYRRCISNFGMHCGLWEQDTTIAQRYLKHLAPNFAAAIQEMNVSHLDAQADTHVSDNDM